MSPLSWPRFDINNEPVHLPFARLLELVLDPRFVELGRVGQLIGWEVL